MPAKKDQQDKKDEKAVEVDFGMGKISFSGLFQGFGNIIDLVSKLEAEGKNAGEGERGESAAENLPVLRVKSRLSTVSLSKGVSAASPLLSRLVM